MTHETARQTLADLADDLDELAALADDAASRLVPVRTHLLRHASAYHKATRARLLQLHSTVSPMYQALRRELRETLARRARWQESDAASLLELKHRAADELRAIQGVAGALIVAGDWQAPTAMAARVPQAGVQTGKIDLTYTDYKLDRHFDAEAFERAYEREYVRAHGRIGVKAHAITSGMAAFTTVLEFLERENKIDGNVLIGENSYFEIKAVVRKRFRERVRDVNEMDTRAILKAVAEHQPAVICLDSLCNAESLAVPDFARLIPLLAKTVTRETYLVLDNSSLGVMHDPLRDFPYFLGNLKLIVWESLNKYGQFGFDRVTGGVIWTHGLRDHFGLTVTRMHGGTNIPDASVQSMPRPNRRLMARRMRRIGRNALRMAQRLDVHIKSLKLTPFSHVVYPGLPSHPAYTWSKGMEFHGGNLVLAFKPAFKNVLIYRLFLTLVMAEAKLRGVNLVAGTSFGFNTARIYLTSMHANLDDGHPFVRLTLGTETAAEMEALEGVLVRAINVLSGRVIGS